MKEIELRKHQEELKKKTLEEAELNKKDLENKEQENNNDKDGDGDKGGSEGEPNPIPKKNVTENKIKEAERVMNKKE